MSVKVRSQLPPVSGSSQCRVAHCVEQLTMSHWVWQPPSPCDQSVSGAKRPIHFDGLPTRWCTIMEPASQPATAQPKTQKI